MNTLSLIQNKKIALALGMIIVVAAIVVSGTGAFFSDSETSANNIFTAGAIDLTVDHAKQTYNGVDCETCSVNLYSSAATTDVVDANEVAAYQGPFPTAAVEISSPHPAWANEATVPPAQWVWIPDVVDASDTTDNTEYTFAQEFYWQGSAVDVDLDLAIAADNGYAIYLNGELIVDELGSEFNYGATVGLDPVETTAFLDAMVTNGNNVLEIVVRNLAGSPDPAQNPAGLLYNITIARDDCEADTDFQKMCQLWNATDLDDGEYSFFNFNDVKPGDEGSNLISIHVDTNDAYVCALPHDFADNDNGINEPESEDGDVTDGADNGELDDVLEFFVWADADGDGTFDGDEDIVVPAGSTIYDLDLGELDVTASETAYLGLMWCAGEQTLDGTTVTCDGSEVDNMSQTDSVSAFLTLYAEQQRNNENFSCEDVNLEGDEDGDDADDNEPDNQTI